MGIEPYLISSTVVAVMAQRLLRVICPGCKTIETPPPELLSTCSHNLSTQAQTQYYRGLGCEQCLQTGYYGRTAIFEMLVIDDDIKELILKRSGSHIIREKAVEKGMSTLQYDGLQKASAGQTSLEEVLRVTQDTLQSVTEVPEHVTA
jgi:general secretion pathway protein E